MRYRDLLSVLHWSSFFLILAMIKGGTSEPWVLALFVGVIGVWVVAALVHGKLGKAGPKLPPGMRRIYPWMHLALYAMLVLTAVAIVFRLIGQPLWFLDAWTMLLLTMSAGAFHGLFHFWRHTALYDGALRLILPRFLHRML
jgi:cytochrome b561